MAMIDYGAVVFKNGVQQNHSMFMDMQEAVGWVDYPRVRYQDCDRVCRDGGYEHSDCSCGIEVCPRCQIVHHSDEKLGEWDEVVGDCKGNPIYREGKIDGNYFAYCGNKHITVGFYKSFALFVVDGVRVKEYFGANDCEDSYDVPRKRAAQFNVGDVHFHIRCVGCGQWWLQCTIDDSYYDVVYGYGIDADERVWNRVKNRYCGKDTARKVDRLYARFKRMARR